MSGRDFGMAAARDLDNGRRRSTLRINATWAPELFLHINLITMILVLCIFTHDHATFGTLEHDVLKPFF